jgi:glycerol-3-phosphate acyltransferase PlsY
VIARWIGLLAGSYLLGSISFSLLAVWALERIDVRTLGSGNAGATNVLRTSGRWPALLVLLLDIGKGVVPVRLTQQLGAPAEVAAGAGVAAIAGHVFPVYFGWRGGKGVATGLGAFLGLFPLAGASAFVLFCVVVAATRIVSVGSLAATASVTPMAWAFGRAGWAAPPSPWTLALALAATFLVFFRHRSNLARLCAGTERRLGQRRAS